MNRNTNAFSKKNLTILKYLEKDDSLDSLKYKNINIFPLVRVALLGGFFVKEKIHKNRIISKLLILFKIPKFAYEKLKLNNNLKSLSKKKIKLVFFSDHSFYYDEIKKKKVNFFIDPYYEILKKKYNSLKVEIVSTNFKESFEKKNKPFYLKLFIIDIIGYLKNSILKTINISKKDNKCEFNLKFLNSCLGEASVIKIMNIIDKINLDSKKIELFLKKIKPKAVFLTCYYSQQNFAIILACKKLKIPSIDIQHGSQEPTHLMYSNWNKIPKNGYELLPDYFWIWGDNQKNEGIFNNCSSKHKYIVGGKLQIDYWKKNKNYSYKKFSKEQNDFLKKKKEYKKIILFTASFIDIPEIVLSLIDKSPKDWLWLIKAHPRHSDLNIINNQFINKKIKNVEVIFPSLTNLNFLLTNVTNLIIELSSVVYDALYFDVPTIILQKKNKHFRKNLNNKNLKFSLNKNEILNFIKRKNTLAKYEKIVTKPKFANYAVKNILKTKLI